MDIPAGSGPIRFRRMMRKDLPEVTAIEHQSFPNPWPDTTFEGEIQNVGLSYPVVAVDEAAGKIAGYLIFWVIRDEAQINNVAVHPDYRRRRIAEGMFRDILAALEQNGIQFISLEVREGNTGARALYEKLGFKGIGFRKEYYSHPVEDAVVMGLSFGSLKL
ncbi:MAG: ribosomal protein S18-alanine N-acetyltransferase [Candidatus Aminicenantales bacterium]